jgi:peptide/nickel transport system permease protein
MISYLVRRLLQVIPTIFVASLLIWGIVYALPGDPIGAILGDNATPAAIAFERERLGLDRPIALQYLTWAGNFFRGDLGFSYFGGEPVAARIARAVLPTLQLGAAAFIFGILLALPIAFFGAVAPGSFVARLTSAQSALSLSVPTFLIGVLFIFVFGVRLQVLPTASAYVPFFQNPIEAVKNLLLPGLTLGIFVSAVFGRFLRHALLDVLGKDYVRTARSKGLRESIVVGRHALRNALLPFVTVAGLQLGSFISGSVVTESVFNYPGLGRLLLTAITQRDYALIQATTMMVVLAVMLINLLVDLVYAALDPRISYS